jgi:recombination protein RecT
MTTTQTPPQPALSPEAETDRQFNSCKDFIQSNRATLEAILPKVLKVDRFIRVVLTEVAKNPKLLECTPSSMMGALLQCGQLGLEPNSVLGHAYLVPFNNRKRNRLEIQLIPGYKGLLVLARRSGEISTIDVHEVRAGDKFEYAYGSNPVLIHKPAKSGRGEIEYFYAVSRMKDGGVQFDVMSKAEVEEHRDRYSKAAQDGPWVTNFREMGMKTPLRRLCKMLPASIELQAAVALDELGESGIPQGLSALAGDVDDSDAETTSNAQTEAETAKMDEIRDKLKEPGATTTEMTETKTAGQLPLETTPEAVDDVLWKEFIEYVDDNLDRAKLKKTVKDKMGIGNLGHLKPTERRGFILSMQDAAKKDGMRFEVFVKE